MYSAINELQEFGEADEFVDLCATRFPIMDGRESNPPTLKELVEHHGWSTRCFECDRPVTAEGADSDYYMDDEGDGHDPVVWTGDIVRCQVCVSDSAQQEPSR